MKKTVIIVLFFIAFLEKVVWDLGPNVELFTAAAVLSAYYLGGKRSFIAILATLVLSDLIIGNTNIFLFTWSGFLIPVVLASKSIRNITDRFRMQILPLTLTGLAFNLFFFFWTNFGVWMLDSWGMYTNDLDGLVRCYFNALPFLKSQIISTLIFIPLGYFLTKILIYLTKYFILQPGLAKKTLL